MIWLQFKQFMDKFFYPATSMKEVCNNEGVSKKTSMDFYFNIVSMFYSGDYHRFVPCT